MTCQLTGARLECLMTFLFRMVASFQFEPFRYLAKDHPPNDLSLQLAGGADLSSRLHRKIVIKFHPVIVRLSSRCHPRLRRYFNFKEIPWG